MFNQIQPLWFAHTGSGKQQQNAFEGCVERKPDEIEREVEIHRITSIRFSSTNIQFPHSSGLDGSTILLSFGGVVVRDFL